MIAAYQATFSSKASCAPDIVATARPKVSMMSKVFPTWVTRLNARVKTTAAMMLAIIHGSVIQIGVRPRNTFLRVPPDTDATAAINAIPP